jgi:hypothetical protein
MISTSIRLATVDEVLSARAYMCFVSFDRLNRREWPLINSTKGSRINVVSDK